MWVARDKDGGLCLYHNRPVKDTPYSNYWQMNDTDDFIVFTWLPSSMFPEVKWEDEEPTEVELIIKQKQ